MRMLFVITLLIQGVWFSCTLAVNRDYGTHPNVFPGSYYLKIVVRMYMYVTPIVQKIEHAIIGSSTTDNKGMVIFKPFAEHKDFGTYHMLFLGVMRLSIAIPTTPPLCCAEKRRGFD